MCDVTQDTVKLVIGDVAKVIDAGGFDLNRWLKGRTIRVLDPVFFQNLDEKLTGCQNVYRDDLLNTDSEYLVAECQETGDVGIIRQAGTHSYRYKLPAAYEIIKEADGGDDDDCADCECCEDDDCDCCGHDYNTCHDPNCGCSDGPDDEDDEIGELPEPDKLDVKTNQFLGTAVPLNKKLRQVNLLHTSLPIINIGTNGPVIYANYFGFDGKRHTARVKCKIDNVPDPDLGRAILFYKIIEREARRFREKVLFRQIKTYTAQTTETIDSVQLDTLPAEHAPLTPITDKSLSDFKRTDRIKDSFQS